MLFFLVFMGIMEQASKCHHHMLWTN
uniref:Uncharacterized protein n=1 Tax=Anguilla anguilla TaxID=7936 RepID=A0A0E9Q214_ANGAN